MSTGAQATGVMIGASQGSTVDCATLVALIAQQIRRGISFVVKRVDMGEM